MLAERIDDQALLRLIGKWLKAGVLDTNGEVIHTGGGNPAGGDCLSHLGQHLFALLSG